jgi:NTE family protein
VRLGVVLSTGGLRGAAHLGVLKRLIAARLPIDVIVGSSVGAVIGAYYAAVGLTIDEIINDAPRMRGAHLLWHSLRYKTPEWAHPWLRARSGIVPERLEALDRARFDQLHHGVSAFGVVCHDLETRRPIYISSAEPHGLTVGSAVRASAAVRPIYPPWSGEANGRRVRLVDGGYSDTLPVEFAARQGLGATHLIVSDCRRTDERLVSNDRTIYVRPAISGFGVVPRVSFSLPEAVAAGEAAVTDAVIARARGWAGSTSVPAAPQTPRR